MLNRLSIIFFELPTYKQRYLLILLGLIFYVPFIGQVHLFDWDEINFAEITREMMLTGEYFYSQIDFRPFYEKPPLFNWIQIAATFAFGKGEFAARFPNALFGIFSLLLIFEIGRRWKNNSFGMLWALLYLGSLLPHFYFKSGVIDPVFNFFIFASVYLLTQMYAAKQLCHQRRYALYAGLVNGLSIITKGPVGFLIVMLTVAAYELLYVRTWSWQRVRLFIIFILAALLVTMLWLLPQYIVGGMEFVSVFMNYMLELLTQNVATHGQPFYYHFVVIFLGCFPISIFAIPRLINNQRHLSVDANKWMFCLFWVVLLLFSIVKTKIVHYSSMTYFPLAYMATDALIGFSKKGEKLPVKLYLIMGLFYFLLFALLPILLIDKSWLLSLSSNDTFTQEIIKSLNLPLVYMIVPLVFLLGIIGSYKYLIRRKVRIAIVLHSLVFAIFFNLELVLLLPAIESAVQGSAISFYERYSGKDVYLTTVGFKSYGRLYYFDKTLDQARYTNDELLNKDLDKPVYFITKITDKQLENRENLQLIDQKNGFLLYLKLPKIIIPNDKK